MKKISIASIIVTIILMLYPIIFRCISVFESHISMRIGEGEKTVQGESWNCPLCRVVNGRPVSAK